MRVQEVLVGRLLWTSCAFAVLLSGVGLFASVAFVVSQRNRELGIQVALGADRAAVLGLVLRSTYFVVLSGVSFGSGWRLCARAHHPESAVRGRAARSAQLRDCGRDSRRGDRGRVFPARADGAPHGSSRHAA